MIIKKIIFILAIILLLFVSPVIVLTQGRGQQQGQPPIEVTEEAKNKGIETATQNLNRVVERNNDSEIGQQVRSMVQNHEKVQERTKTALQQMDKRNQAMKLLIGPDYKNAGQVRRDVVGLRNDIRKLEQIKEKSLPTDTEDIQGAINKLQVEAEGLETQLTEKLSGFSLFGWLAKLLAR